MNNVAKIARLQHLLDTMEFLPADSSEGIERDRFWKSELESELAVLQHRTMRNSLAALFKVENHLITLKGL